VNLQSGMAVIRRAPIITLMVLLATIAIVGSVAVYRYDGDEALPPVKWTGTQRLPQEIYVWQRRWSPAVRDALQAITAASGAGGEPPARGFRVLVAQLNAGSSGGEEQMSARHWQWFEPELDALAATQLPVTAVFRIDGSLRLATAKASSGLLGDAAVEEASAESGDNLIAGIASWYLHADQGVWRGIEIDFDCPTRELADYARWLARLRARLDQAGLAGTPQLSVTALPTWEASPALIDVLDQVDESVLQVHSVIDPRRGLFDAALAEQWIAAYARRNRKDFWVAIPNYGAKVAWNTAGQVAAISSDDDHALGPAVGEELSIAPDQLLRFIQALSRRHPTNLKGLVWFRLPVAGDRRIWSIGTLRAIMETEATAPVPSSMLSSELERGVDGVTRIWLRNDGVLDAVLPDLVEVGSPCLAADGLGVYALEHLPDRIVLHRRHGALLRGDQRTAIAWLRCPISAEAVTVSVSIGGNSH
jgi:hypothetical protein